MKRTYLHNLHWIILLIIPIILNISACKKYLELKPDKSLAVPSTLQDLQALLDAYTVMNQGFQGDAEAAADNYYLTDLSWNNLSQQYARDNYIWKADAEMNTAGWSAPYVSILYANQVLESLTKIKPGANEKVQYNEIKGSALFYRAYAFHQLAQVYMKPFDAATASNDLGIPLRLTSDVSEKTVRSSVKETYDRIIEDFKQALPLLPLNSGIASSPNKTACYAALARTYLNMASYTQAGIYADSCLNRYNTLIDYKALNAQASFPLVRFNSEVIYQSVASALVLGPNNGKINPDLYLSYDNNDLRKIIFFRKNNDGTTYQFKGNYNGSASNGIFTGLATDEIYLIRAECNARSGNTTLAMQDLNLLLKNRYDNTFSPLTANNTLDAIKLIIKERRKELLYRCLRWSDLRRLNKEPSFETTLTRTLNGQIYTLPPNDSRYVLLIPNQVLARVDIPQNPR